MPRTTARNPKTWNKSRYNRKKSGHHCESWQQRALVKLMDISDDAVVELNIPTDPDEIRKAQHAVAKPGKAQ